MEFGIGVGAFASGLIYANEAVHFITTFMVCGVLVGVAFLFLFLHRSRSAGSQVAGDRK
jgi:predicted MFS family arabinose efflux permease